MPRNEMLIEQKWQDWREYVDDCVSRSVYRLMFILILCMSFSSNFRLIAEFHAFRWASLDHNFFALVQFGFAIITSYREYRLSLMTKLDSLTQTRVLLYKRHSQNTHTHANGISAQVCSSIARDSPEACIFSIAFRRRLFFYSFLATGVSSA